MKICKKHWDTLIRALIANGLQALMSTSDEEYTKKQQRDALDDYKLRLENWDPLVTARDQIYDRAIAHGGPTVFALPDDMCPVCMFDQKGEWAWNAAAFMKEYYEKKKAEGLH